MKDLSPEERLALLGASPGTYRERSPGADVIFGAGWRRTVRVTLHGDGSVTVHAPPWRCVGDPAVQGPQPEGSWQVGTHELSAAQAAPLLQEARAQLDSLGLRADPPERDLH
ncbi:hypothetical protein [Deinococcus soli (ex Cha et al. 2016)]|uniref:Uncharacterized protein n=2 Tax=Deinococcus soli (ex Cha et al. 2016) TaxID=1309411 RepID=A0ACC6KKP7_9DEIO|nr:hypothetical protein [Deinococcus soli (ex Cha et al. 2016)]MDR6218563.1 hypothetical protein [Deinococcus soli (ex Cha et al. 2016)]MDR6328360.1 hypothetical protein [Deinococcus soli (ex Cha et al. 2016)]MDR6752971.1 hypothetical protein [Deinococcus soli (ex Cha et al. 2016)]